MVTQYQMRLHHDSFLILQVQDLIMLLLYDLIELHPFQIIDNYVAIEKKLLIY
jgi:hypothetical protein